MTSLMKYFYHYLIHLDHLLFWFYKIRLMLLFFIVNYHHFYILSNYLVKSFFNCFINLFTLTYVILNFIDEAYFILILILILIFSFQLGFIYILINFYLFNFLPLWVVVWLSYYEYYLLPFLVIYWTIFFSIISFLMIIYWGRFPFIYPIFLIC